MTTGPGDREKSSNSSQDPSNCEIIVRAFRETWFFGATPRNVNIFVDNWPPVQKNRTVRTNRFTPEFREALKLRSRTLSC